jgi:AAA domain
MRSAMTRTELVDTVKDSTALEAAHGRLIENLNTPQRQAVATVFDPSFKTGFFAVQGPPGTVKSTVISTMIAVIGSGILVAAPSNAAVASVAVKSFLRSRDQFDLLDLVVFEGNCDPMAHFLNPCCRGERFAKFIKECDAATSNVQAATLKNEFSRWLHLDESKDYTVSELRQLCPYIDMKTSGGRARLDAFLSRAKVVFSTLNSTGSATLRASLSVHTLILDEAGQSPEAEFYVATTVPDIKRIVVVGDPKQLPSTVIDPACQSAGYGVSWLAKVHNLFPQKVHLLSVQYRMDPLILEFPNEQFYKGEINSACSVLGRKRADRPFRFIDTAGHGREKNASFSWSNMFEIQIIKHLLATDPDIKRLQSEMIERGTQPRLMVITPYKAQVALLKDRLRAPDECRLDIATVDSFQGQEAHIVIYSTVRTCRVGFTDSPERINVAITRSISILRVVGDLSFFLSLGASSTLRKLAAFASTGVHVVSPHPDCLAKPSQEKSSGPTPAVALPAPKRCSFQSQASYYASKSAQPKARANIAAQEVKAAKKLNPPNGKVRKKKTKKNKKKKNH